MFAEFLEITAHPASPSNWRAQTDLFYPTINQTSSRASSSMKDCSHMITSRCHYAFQTQTSLPSPPFGCCCRWHHHSQVNVNGAPPITAGAQELRHLSGEDSSSTDALLRETHGLTWSSHQMKGYFILSTLTISSTIYIILHICNMLITWRRKLFSLSLVSGYTIGSLVSLT